MPRSITRPRPPGLHTINLQYNVTEGSAQFVRDVVVSGLRTSRRRLVDPLISLHPGDPLSWSEMGRMQRRLYNLGVFDKVDMAIQNADSDTAEKYVDFHCVEGHLYTMAVGVGAEIAKIGGSATDISNPTGTTGFAPRFDLQLSRLNMWGLGHSVNFNGRYSTLDRRASLSYSAPRFHNVEGRNITVSGLYDNTRDVLTFTAVKLQGAVQVSQRIDKATNLLFRYTWTDDRVDQNTLKISPLLIPLYSQPSRVGSSLSTWCRTAATIQSTRTAASITASISDLRLTISAATRTSCVSWGAIPITKSWEASCWPAIPNSA